MILSLSILAHNICKSNYINIPEIIATEYILKFINNIIIIKDIINNDKINDIITNFIISDNISIKLKLLSDNEIEYIKILCEYFKLQCQSHNKTTSIYKGLLTGGVKWFFNFTIIKQKQLIYDDDNEDDECYYCNTNTDDVIYCQDCGKTICWNCVEDNSVFNDISWGTEKYCNECAPEWLIQQNIDDENLLNTQNDRETELIVELKKYGLELRNDSSYCNNYIYNNDGDIDEIVNRMCEMKFLFEYCNFRNEIQNVKEEHGEISEAGYFPDCSTFEEAEYNILRYTNYPDKWPWL